MNPCFLCQGQGGWLCEDHTEICPVCRPRERELLARQNAVSSTDWDIFWQRYPAKHIGPLFQVPPTLIVVHSGQENDNVAEYFQIPGDRVVSAHLAWSRKEQALVQCCPLNRVAWHCGGSSMRGKGHLNFCSIGIELPGPYNKRRSEDEIAQFRLSVFHLMSMFSTLRTITRHSDIDDRKKDPGRGFSWDWCKDMHLEIFSKA